MYLSMKNKRIIVLILCIVFPLGCSFVGREQSLLAKNDVAWSFDHEKGTLFIEQEEACTLWNDQIPKEKVKRIVFQDGITSIPDNAFCYLPNLSEIVFPNSLRTIGNHSFRFNNKLKKIQIPKELSDIGICTFDAVETVIVDPENPFLIENNGVVYTKDKTKIVFAAKKINTITVPNSVTLIGDGAFLQCSEMQSIVLPAALQEIGQYAFMGCVSLKTIDLPHSLKKIGEYAFADCLMLKEIRIPEKTDFEFVSENYYFSGSGIGRIIFEGNSVDFMRYLIHEEGIKEVICLSVPPKTGKDTMNLEQDYTIFYLKKNQKAWAPNGETEWNGIPIIGIDSLDDLLPLD